MACKENTLGEIKSFAKTFKYLRLFLEHQFLLVEKNINCSEPELETKPGPKTMFASFKKHFLSKRIKASRNTNEIKREQAPQKENDESRQDHPNSSQNHPKQPPKQRTATKLDCMTKVNARDISFDVVQAVTDSWESKVRKLPNWLPITGELFLRKMFELDPETKTMFGFPEDTRHDDPALKNDEKFMTKGIRLIEAVDIAIGFLGPDLDPLEQTLFELGGRHVERQCRPHHWPIVGMALFYVFEQCLGDEFTFDLRESWTIMYNFLSYHMIQGLLAKCPALAEGPASSATAVQAPIQAAHKSVGTGVCPVKHPASPSAGVCPVPHSSIRKSSNTVPVTPKLRSPSKIMLDVVTLKQMPSLKSDLMVKVHPKRKNGIRA